MFISHIWSPSLSDFLTLSGIWLKSKFFVALLRYWVLVAKTTDCVSAFCCFGQVLYLNFSRLTKCDETDVWLCKIRILVHSGMLLCARLFVMHSAETNCGMSCLARVKPWQRTILHTKAEKYDGQVLDWFSGHLCIMTKVGCISDKRLLMSLFGGDSHSHYPVKQQYFCLCKCLSLTHFAREHFESG